MSSPAAPWLRRLLLASLITPLAAALAAPAGAAPRPAASPGCAAPQPGRYVLMGRGEAIGEPVAALLQETWSADGRISGLRLLRRGRTYQESRYSGRWRPISLCRVAIERDHGPGTTRSQAVLDPAGRPRHSIGTIPEVVVPFRWFAQPDRPCSSTSLAGTVLSQQQGLSWRNGRWNANAVVQHERWQAGAVQGIAVSSYGPRIEEATYSGTITVEPSCLATIRQKDSLGTPYHYRAIVLADGGGYLYLQTDPDDLTVGALERVGP